MDKISLANMTRMATKDLDLEIKTRVLKELLIENGTITDEEFKERCDNIESRYYANIRNELNKMTSNLEK